MTTENNTTQAIAATPDDKLDYAITALSAALGSAEEDGRNGVTTDNRYSATLMLEELERRVTGVAPEGHLYFAMKEVA